MTLDKYKVRLTQLENNGKELYEGEADVIRAIVSKLSTCN